MKKCMFVILIILIELAILCSSKAYGETMDRKLTLMIYMCGSNLESGYGAASADIEEMKAAGLKGKEVTVLLMTGGTKQWSQGYDASKCLIHELGPRGTRVVWQSDAMNMGEPETLTQLLQFGKEAYPAEDYALILWNHGGGPMEGVCWDELFSLDRLTLSELASAIERADMGKKLSWIGFDACLMGSVEVASALAPYAEYMIASQETEPAKGWNYEFLKDLDKDESGAQTGIRIVDTFFDGIGETNDVLTLSCLELSKIEALTNEMDQFFQGLGNSVNINTFSNLSGVRRRTTSYGKSVTEAGSDDYDLVDLGDLIQNLDGWKDSSESLIDAIQKAIVYSRSNLATTQGISVYHPLVNKAKYIDFWKQNYEGLQFCPGYTEYIEHFGKILTGEKLTSWEDLSVRNWGLDDQQNELFSVQLNQEQIANYSSAKLLILMVSKLNDNSGNDSYMLVSSVPASMDETGSLIAAYSGRALYVVTEENQWIGPISYTFKQETETNNVIVVYTSEGRSYADDSSKNVIYSISNEEQGQIPEIIQTRVFDNFSDTYTNRIAFDPEGMDTAMFYFLDRTLPELGEDQVFPGFMNWENNSKVIAKVLPLPNAWHFEYSKGQLSNAQLYATFQITDSQQNTYCTPLVPVNNPNMQEVPLFSNTIETNEYKIEMSVYKSLALSNKGIEARIQITNLSRVQAEYRFDNIKLNDTRLVAADWSNRSLKIPSHETRTINVFIDSDQLVYLDELHSIFTYFTLERFSGSGSQEAKTLRWEAEPTDITVAASRYESMAETMQQDAFVRLLRLSPAKNGFRALLYIDNQRADSLKINSAFCNGFDVDNYFSETIPAKTDAVVLLDINNSLSVGIFDGVSMPGFGSSEDTYHNILVDRHILQQQGVESISRLDIVANSSKKYKDMEIFSLQLADPWPIQEDTSYRSSLIFDTYDVSDFAEYGDEKESILYYNNSQYRIAVNRIFIGENGTVLCLKIVNCSGKPILVEYDNLVLNQHHYVNSWNSSDFVAPNSVRFTSLIVGDRSSLLPAGMEISSIGFSVALNDLEPYPDITIILNEPVFLGNQDIMMLTAKDWEVQSIKIAYASAPEPRKPGEVRLFESSVDVPEKAKNYSSWIAAPLSIEEQQDIARGWMTIVKVIDENYLRLVTHQSLQNNEKNEFGVNFPGLILCLSEEPDLFVFSYPSFHGTDIEYKMHNKGIMFWCLTNDDNPDVTGTIDTTSLTVLLDLENNASSLSSYEIDGNPGQFQEDVTGIWLLTADIIYEQNEKGEYPSISTMSFYRGFDWYLNSPEFTLNSQPLRLALRSITPEDGFYLLFSFERKDGSSFSLAPIPYRQGTQALNNPTEIYMPSNFRMEPPLTILPADAATDLFWTTDNENVAYINKEGMLVTEETGTAHLTVTDRSSGLSSTVVVYSCGPITDITFAEESVILEVGASYSVIAYVTIGDHECVNQFVSFSTSDETLVTIDDAGAVTPLRAGKAIITATAENGVTSSCTITVKAEDNNHYETNKEKKPTYAQILSVQPNGYCYLYDQPSDIDGNNLGRYNNGETVEILEDDPINGYYLVNCSDGKVCYVHTYAVSFSFSYAQSAASLIYWVCSTEPMGYCYLYDQPNDIDGNNLGRYDNGEQIEIIDWWASDTYALVRCVSTEKVGYITPATKSQH